MEKKSSAQMYNENDMFMSRSALIKKFKEVHPPQKPERHDSVDAEINRRIGEIRVDRASLFNHLFALGSIATFLADIVTDVLVAKQHFDNGDTAWFVLTCCFIILPSLIMQVYSCKWFNEDCDEGFKWWTYLLHLFQLGTIERYIIAFWYGMKTRRVKSCDKDDYVRYLTEWRDITLLRLFEGFLEAAPQMILQLYILTSQNEFIVSRDWLTATSAVISIISLSWAIVSYSQMLRLCLSKKTLSICGYIFQIWYRLFMVASRVVVLVLFASAFKGYIFFFLFGHCLTIFAWLRCIDSIKYTLNADRNEHCADIIFTLIVSVIYIYCFLNVNPGTTTKQVSIYYGILFFESTALMGAWYPYKTLDGALMYAAFGVVFGGFALGIICMLWFYSYFHPNQDVASPWLCCLRQQSDNEMNDPMMRNTSFICSETDDELVIINYKQKSPRFPLDHSPAVPRSKSSDVIPMEMLQRPTSNRRSGATRIKKSRSLEQNRTPDGSADTQYGACSSPTDKSFRYTVLSDGFLETGNKYRHPGVSEKWTSNGVIANDTASEKTSNKWIVRVSKTKSPGSWCDDSNILACKAELGAIQLADMLSTKDTRLSRRLDAREGTMENSTSTLDKNSNEKMTEKCTLIVRQGSKDDTHLLQKEKIDIRPRKVRANSLPEKYGMKENLSAFEKMTEKEIAREENEDRNSVLMAGEKFIENQDTILKTERMQNGCFSTLV